MTVVVVVVVVLVAMMTMAVVMTVAVVVVLLKVVLVVVVVIVVVRAPVWVAGAVIDFVEVLIVGMRSDVLNIVSDVTIDLFMDAST